MGTMIRTLFAGLVAMAMLSGCSGGLSADGGATAVGGGNQGQGTNPGTGGGTTQPIDNIDMKGYVDGGDYDQTKTFDLDKTTGHLLVNLPLGLDSSIILGSGSVPSLQGVSFTTVIGADGRTYIQFRIPISYVLRGVNTLPANRLPNGDPLPMMPAGEYPSTAFAIDTHTNELRKVYLYIGVDAIGIFVESKWLSCQGLPICINPTFPIKNTARTKVVGYLSLIMAKGQSSGGFFISTVLPPDLARILDEYFIR